MQPPGCDKFIQPARASALRLEVKQSTRYERLSIVKDVERGFPTDETPEGDAADQLRPVDSGEAGLDIDYLAADRDANEADVIEQAYTVPEEDDWDDR